MIILQLKFNNGDLWNIFHIVIINIYFLLGIKYELSFLSFMWTFFCFKIRVLPVFVAISRNPGIYLHMPAIPLPIQCLE